MNFVITKRIVSALLSAIIGLFVCAIGQADDERYRETHVSHSCDRILAFTKRSVIIPDAYGGSRVGMTIPWLNLNPFVHYKLFLVNGYVEIEFGSDEFMYDMVTKFPLAMKRRGFYNSGDKLYAPGTRKSNMILDSFRGTENEKSFRFVDWFPPESLKQQHYSSSKFLEFIAKDLILLATRGYYFVHDRVNFHMISVQFMPDIVFRFYKARVEFLLKVRTYLENEPESSENLAPAIDELAAFWDGMTERIGIELAENNIDEAGELFLKMISGGYSERGLLYPIPETELVTPKDHANHLINHLTTKRSVSELQRQQIHQLAASSFSGLSIPRLEVLLSELNRELQN